MMRGVSTLVAHLNKKRDKIRRKRKKPLVIALSVVISVFVIGIVAVWCVLLIKKGPEALNITASVEMNGIKRDIKENELVNKLPHILFTKLRNN